MKRSSHFATLASAVLAFGSIADNAQGALTLTLNELTTDTLSFSVSGTFDTDVQGTSGEGGLYESVFAIKANYFENVGVNTDWMDDSIGFSVGLSPAFTVDENTLASSGAPGFTVIVSSNGVGAGDSIAFYQTSSPGNFGNFIPITAGTSLSGTLTLTSPGAFSPASVDTLDLVSGFNVTDELTGAGNWVTQEAFVPEPSSALLVSLGAFAFAFSRRKR